MNNPGELLTVKAFSEASGRSQQTIYKQIQTRLAAYVHEDGGQKLIERRALREVFHIEEDQPDSTKNSTEQNNRIQPSPDVLQLAIEALKQQLETKDRQIEQLQAHIDDLTRTLQTAQSNLKAEQMLHAGTMQQLAAAPEEPETSPEQPDPIQEEIAMEDPEPEQEEVKEPRPISWIDKIRLFFGGN